MQAPSHPIGIFDSGYGGLTVFRSIKRQLPGYDYLYMGDNSRAPYGNRSFETVYHYTLQCVEWFFAQGCPLVILACNTASAKALRSIQQNDLPRIAPDNRVLGVIRPTAEVIGNFSATGKIGVMGTRGTVNSGSYVIETEKFFPGATVYQQSCPLWVPLIENGEYASAGADYFVKKYVEELLAQDAGIDTIMLACTHYPLLLEKIKQYLPAGVQAIPQGDIVAQSLADYLHRHPEMEQRITRTGSTQFFTTDSPADFNHHAAVFFGEEVTAQHIDL